MLFSVVIPVYNVEKYLNECLDAIVEQALALENECEIILVDDGSTDSSGEICDNYSNRYSKIFKVFHNTNHGLLYTRRFGYQQACGEYIVNCDSDDKLEKNALVKLKNVINENNHPDMIIFNYYSYKDGNSEITFKDIFTKKKECKVTKQEVLRQYMIGYSIISVCVSICKRTCIDVENDYSKFGYVNNGEDSLQKLEQFDYAKTYFYINEPLYYYRMGSGMTIKYDPNYYESFNNLFREIEKRKEQWKIPNFNDLMAIKSLATAGRAITQSRYANYSKIDDHIQYLKKIRENEYFRKYIVRLKNVEKNLQRNYRILLWLLENQHYKIIVTLLNIKNWKE